MAVMGQLGLNSMTKALLIDKEQFDGWAKFILSESEHKINEPESYPAVLVYRFYDDIRNRTAVVYDYVYAADLTDE